MKTILVSALLLASVSASAAKKVCEDVALSVKATAIKNDHRQNLIRIGKVCVETREVTKEEAGRQIGTFVVTLTNLQNKEVSKSVMHATEADAGMGKEYLTLARTEADLNVNDGDESENKIVLVRVNDESEVRRGQPHGHVSLFGQRLETLKK